MTRLLLTRTQRAITAAGLLAAAGCSSGATAGLEPQPGVTSITVAAVPSEISTGELATVRARGATASGAAALALVGWTASGGQLVAVSDSEAEFSAALPGTYWVIARAVAEPYPADSVLITVSLPSSPVVAIRIAPDSLSLLPGTGATFSALGTRQDGSTLVLPVGWSATGGTITQSGAYLAGNASGDFEVVAVYQGGALADTSAVIIQSSGTGGSGYPNEPPGLVTPYTITAPQPHPFDSLPRFWNAADGRRWYALDPHGWEIEAGGDEPGDPTRWSIVNDPDRGNVLNMELRAGDPGGTSPMGYAAAGFGHDSRLSSGPQAPFVARQLFLGYWVKLGPNWADPNVAMKHLYFFNSLSDGNWYINLSSHDFPYLNGGYQIQHTGMPTYDWYGPGASASRGVWHRYEMYARFNTSGNRDGTLKVWIDGRLVVNRSDLMLGNQGRDFDWAKFGIITGGGGNPVPVNTYVRFDDWYIKVGP